VQQSNNALISFLAKSFSSLICKSIAPFSTPFTVSFLTGPLTIFGLTHIRLQHTHSNQAAQTHTDLTLLYHTRLRLMMTTRCRHSLRFKDFPGLGCAWGYPDRMGTKRLWLEREVRPLHILRAGELSNIDKSKEIFSESRAAIF
jgi:hypothetical protein